MTLEKDLEDEMTELHDDIRARTNFLEDFVRQFGTLRGQSQRDIQYHIKIIETDLTYLEGMVADCGPPSFKPRMIWDTKTKEMRKKYKDQCQKFDEKLSGAAASPGEPDKSKMTEHEQQKYEYAHSIHHETTPFAHVRASSQNTPAPQKSPPAVESSPDARKVEARNKKEAERQEALRRMKKDEEEKQEALRKENARMKKDEEKQEALRKEEARKKKLKDEEERREALKKEEQEKKKDPRKEEEEQGEDEFEVEAFISATAERNSMYTVTDFLKEFQDVLDRRARVAEVTLFLRKVKGITGGGSGGGDGGSSTANAEVVEYVDVTAMANPRYTRAQFTEEFLRVVERKPTLKEVTQFLTKQKSPATLPALHAPSVVGDYTLVFPCLGRGSFGEVYKCTKTKKGGDGGEGGGVFAIKKVFKEKVNSDIEQDFASRLSPMLNSKFLVRYYENFIGPDGNTYVVMDLCTKGDLRKLINNFRELGKQDALLAPVRVMKIFTQLLLGLSVLHHYNILHRDLKPDNVFLDKDDNVKIGDFGCARLLDSSSKEASTVIGTPLYESPEVVKGEKYNALSDMWSLGVILYELCTLELPFFAQNTFQLHKLINAGVYKPIPDMRYPSEICAIVKELLSVNRENRPTAFALLHRPFIQQYGRSAGFLQYYPKEGGGK